LDYWINLNIVANFFLNFGQLTSKIACVNFSITRWSFFSVVCHISPHRYTNNFNKFFSSLLTTPDFSLMSIQGTFLIFLPRTVRSSSLFIHPFKEGIMISLATSL